MELLQNLVKATSGSEVTIFPKYSNEDVSELFVNTDAPVIYRLMAAEFLSKKNFYEISEEKLEKLLDEVENWDIVRWSYLFLFKQKKYKNFGRVFGDWKIQTFKNFLLSKI